MKTTTIRITEPTDEQRRLAKSLTPQERIEAIAAAAKKKINQKETT